ncbi:MAG: hypothetical protein AAF529_08455 [Pseudomonadota bacterium]
MKCSVAGMRAACSMAAVLLVWMGPAHAQPPYVGPGIAGLVVAAEHRYDPAVQRLLADLSLRALPLLDGQLYYVYPMQNSSAHLETLQIQYLEQLLRREPSPHSKNDAEIDEPPAP